MLCNFQVGFFIVRPCGRSGVALCSKCQSPVCDAHRSLKSGTKSDYICYKCLPPTNDRDDSRTSTYDSSSSTSSSGSYSGRGGTFGGAGASSHWNTSQPSNPTMLGAIPAGSAAGIAATSASPATPLETAGFSQDDADLFNEVSSFDEKNDGDTSFDS